MTLPEQRAGPLPAWPLASPTARERDLWRAEWKRPQAAMWEVHGQLLEVALFVRAVVAAEGPKATATDRGLVLRYLDSLGITTAGLARNRWTIGRPVMVDDRRNQAPAASGSSAKSRLRSLDGGAA